MPRHPGSSSSSASGSGRTCGSASKPEAAMASHTRSTIPVLLLSLFLPVPVLHRFTFILRTSLLQQTSDSCLEGSEMTEKVICPSNSISSCCILATYLAAYCPRHQICGISYKMLTMVSIPCLVFLPSSYAMVSIPCYSVI